MCRSKLAGWLRQTHRLLFFCINIHSCFLFFPTNTEVNTPDAQKSLGNVMSGEKRYNWRAMINVVKLLDRGWAIDQPSFLTVSVVWPASTVSEKQTNPKKKQKNKNFLSLSHKGETQARLGSLYEFGKVDDGKCDMDSIYTSEPAGVALTLASLFFSTGCQADTTTHRWSQDSFTTLMQLFW